MCSNFSLFNKISMCQCQFNTKQEENEIKTKIWSIDKNYVFICNISGFIFASFSPLFFLCIDLTFFDFIFSEKKKYKRFVFQWFLFKEVGSYLRVKKKIWHTNIFFFSVELTFCFYFFFLFFFAGENWGLPLAIAANLHIPYRIKIGIDQLEDIQIVDAIGQCKYFIGMLMSFRWNF